MENRSNTDRDMAEKKKHLVRGATTPMGMKASDTYDAYGNRLTTVNQKAAGEALMRTEAECGADQDVGLARRARQS